MTFAAVGSPFTWDSGGILFTPHGVGNLVVVGALTKLATTPTLTGISSSNATWTQLTPTTVGSLSNTAGAIWVGTVTSTSQASVTLTWSGGSAPSFWQLDNQEFSSTVGAWYLDTSGYLDKNSSNAAYASLIPALSGELYYGTHYDNSGASVGSTPGYVYTVDSHGNGMAYNVNCGAGAQAPTWADSAVWGGPMALIAEGTPTLTVSTTSLPAASTGIAYSQTVAAVHGTSPYTWSVSSGSLPAWASLNSSTGAITGTPSSGQGGSTFTIEVTDDVGATATQSLTIDVRLPVTLVGSVGKASGTTSPLTAVYGQTPTAGNLLLALVSAGSTTAETPNLATSASGWTRLTAGSIGNNPSGTSLAIVDAWAKTAVGGDSAPTFTQTLSGTPELTCFMFELNDVDLSDIVDVQAVQQTGSATSTVTFSLTTASPVGGYGEFAVSIMAQERTSSTLTWTESGSGWTSQGKLPASGAAVLFTQSNSQAAPTPAAALSDGGHWSTQSTARGAALLLAIQGAPVVGGADNTATASLTVTPSTAATATRTGASKTATGSLTITPDPSATATRTAAAARTATAKLTVTPQTSAARTRGAFRAAALTVTPDLSAAGTRTGAARTATAALTVTPSLSATPSRTGASHTATASLTVEPSLSAARTRSTFRSASLTVDPQFTASRVAGRLRTAQLDVTPTLTATSTQQHIASASLTVDPQLTADASSTGAQARTRTASLQVTPSLTAAASRTAATANTSTASLTVDPSFSAVPSRTGAAHTATASLTVDLSFSAVPSTTGATAYTSTAGLLVVPSFAAARTLGHTRSAALAVDPSFTATRTAAFVRSAALVVTLHLAGHAQRTGRVPTVPLIITAGPPHGRWSALPPRGRYSAGEPHGQWSAADSHG